MRRTILFALVLAAAFQTAFTQAKPDLIITGSVSVSPNPVTAGNSVTVSYTVRNQGTATANQSTTRIQIKNASNVLLTESYFTTSALSAGVSRTENRSLSISSSAAAGTYTVYVILDYNNAIGQSNTSNDIYSTSLTIQQLLPDLVVSSLSVSSTTVQAGSQVTVSLTVLNQGSGSAPSSLTRIRLAAGTTITVNDPLLDAFTVGSLTANQSQSFSRTVTIPSTTAPGNYYMGATANADAAITESNGNNNQRTTPVTIIIGADNATFVSKTIADNTQMTPGQGFSVTFRMRNSGTTTWTTGASGHTLNFVSGSQMGAPNYVTLSSSVNPGSEVNISIPMTAPTTQGTYTGYWRMNNPSRVFFGDQVYVQIVVTSAKSDLIPQNLAVTPNSGPAGSNATVSFTVRNQGSGTANSSTTNIRINTSTSNVTTTDPLLASISLPSIAAGGTYSVNQPVTIPSNRPTGTNYIWAILDVNSTANQSDETNDKANVPFTVQPLPGSARVSQGVTITPAPVVVGQNFQGSFTLTEVQGGPITFESITIAILRTDNSHVVDMDYRTNISIPASGAYQYSSTPQWRTTDPPGNYKAVARGKLPGGNWFDFLVTGSGINSVPFTVQQDLPPPTLVSPGSSSAPGPEITTTTPTLQWNAVTGVAKYGVYISEYPYGEANQVYSNENILASSISHSVPSGRLENGKRYRWKAASFNSAGQYRLSDPLYFIINTGPLPDLTISAVVGSSYTAGQAGVQIPVTVTRTGGNLTQGTFVDAHLFWSTNSTWDASDIRLWRSNNSIPDFPNSVLNSAGSKTVTATINIPSAQNGTYYILAVVDPSNFHSESNENNNVTPYATNIGSPPPFSLSFPLQGKTPWTASINSVFDHSMTSPYSADNIVVAYTGEKGQSQYGQDYVTTISGNALYGFKNSSGSNFSVNANYTGGGKPNFLYYDGHPGYDYRTIDQSADGKVSVYAAASGTARWMVGSPYNTLYIDHGNGYTTHYLHLSQRIIPDGASVAAGQLIGISGDAGVPGSPHLHFEVQLNGIPVDPYGWQGSGSDPYTRALNKNLWQGSANNPPNIPTAVNQFKSDGTTAISEGGTTNESTVIFKGTVSDPDGDQVRLEIELRQTNEAFTGTPTPETISSFVNSGNQVPPITRGGLVNGSYKWQYRAVDSKGAASQWREFGTAGNTDFIVNITQTGTVMANATLNGSPWSGNVSYRITGAQTIDGSSVPQTYPNRQAGTYTISYISGGPSGATFKDITPSATQTLSAGGTITFTMNFTSSHINPTPQEISDLADQLSTTYKVPSVIIKALLEQESEWRQFTDSGSPLINNEPDGRIGIGLTQVTVQPTPSIQSLSLGKIEPGTQGSNPFVTTTESINVDIDRLKTDWRYNMEIGVRVLVAKKVESAGAPDDARVLENWYYPLAYYNGAVKGGSNDPTNPVYTRSVSSNQNWKSTSIFPFQECVFNIIAQLYTIPSSRSAYFGPPIKVTLPGPSAVSTGSGRYNYVETIFCFFDWAIYFEDGTVRIGNWGTRNNGCISEAKTRTGIVVHSVPFGPLTATPTIVVSTASLPSFGNIPINTNSTPQSYTVSGSNLTANIVITAPTGFQVSTSQTTGFANSLTLTQSGGNVQTTTIWARFSPTVAQPYSGNITHTSTGATTQNVSVSGTGIPGPAITLSQSSLSFGNVPINTNSTPQSYTVSGSNLTANIVITAPTGFQVSTSQTTGFASSITLTQSGGNVQTTTIWARFSPTAAQSYSGNIAHISAGVTTVYVAVTGTGTTSGTSLTIGTGQVSTVGQQVSVPITVQNFTNIGSISLRISYSSSILTFTGIANAPANTQANASGGNINISWFSTSPLSLSNDSKLLDLQFTYNGGLSTGASTPISFVTSACELTNATGTSLSVAYQDGKVELSTGYTVSGIVRYLNSDQTPISNVTVTLTPTTGSSQTTMSGTDGSFSFSNVASATYTLTGTKTGNWGGVTTADALLVQLHVVGIQPITDPLVLAAADVNNSGTITTADALMIQLRVVGLSTTFPKGDWVFSSHSLSVSSSNVTQNVSGLCVGDVNRSYLPSSGGFFSKQISSSSIVSPAAISLKIGTVPVPQAGQTVNVPITVQSFSNVGSFTLRISYNSSILTFLGVINSPSGIQANAIDGTLNMSWFSTSPLSIQDGGKLLDVQFRYNGGLSQSASSAVTFVTSNCEVTDALGAPLSVSYQNGSVLTSIYTTTILPKEYALSQNYPNPFNPSTTIRYALPTRSYVKLEILNLLGQRIAELVNGEFEAGYHQVEWQPSSGVATGIYFYRIEAVGVDNPQNRFVETKKMLILR